MTRIACCCCYGYGRVRTESYCYFTEEYDCVDEPCETCAGSGARDTATPCDGCKVLSSAQPMRPLEVACEDEEGCDVPF